MQVRRQPMPGGGWVSTTRTSPNSETTRAAADERLSLQALIDWLPDNLWVKDVNSRFVIANQVTATRIGVAEPADLIGKTDLELLPPEIAQKFFADEQEIVRTGAADDRHGGIRLRRLGRQDMDPDDESAAAQRRAAKSSAWSASRATSPSASWPTPCATGRRKSSK